MVGRVPTSHSQNGSVLRDRLVQPPHFRVKETEAQKVEVICLWSSSRFVAETGLFPSIHLDGDCLRDLGKHAISHELL